MFILATASPSSWKEYFPGGSDPKDQPNLRDGFNIYSGNFQIVRCTYDVQREQRAINIWGLQQNRANVLIEECAFYNVRNDRVGGGACVKFDNGGSIVQTKNCFKNCSSVLSGQSSRTYVGTNSKNYYIQNTYSKLGILNQKDAIASFYAERGEVKIDQCNVSDNTMAGSCGFAIANINAEASISYVNCVNNFAKKTNNYPNGIGVITYNGPGRYNVKYCNHYNCHAYDRQILVMDGNCKVQWTSCIIDHCGSERTYVFFLMGYLTLTNCYYGDNIGWKVGGWCSFCGTSNLIENGRNQRFSLDLKFYQIGNCYQKNLINPPSRTPTQSPTSTPKRTPARSASPSPSFVPHKPPPTPKRSPTRSPPETPSPSPRPSPAETPFDPVIYNSSETAGSGPNIDFHPPSEIYKTNGGEAAQGGSVNKKDDKPDDSIGAIIIAVVAGIAAVGLIAAAVYFATRAAELPPEAALENAESVPTNSPSVENDNPIYGEGAEDPFANEFEDPE